MKIIFPLELEDVEVVALMRLLREQAVVSRAMGDMSLATNIEGALYRFDASLCEMVADELAVVRGLYRQNRPGPEGRHRAEEDVPA